MSVFADAIVLKSGIEKNQLIELYTSEGCSSCPPADEWLSKLKEDAGLWSRVVPIAFHVDYWDRLGWKDGFASREFSDRQRRYQYQGNISQVYTPGFVIDGKEWRGFFRRQPFEKVSSVNVGELNAIIISGKIDIDFSPLQESSDELMFHVARLGFDVTSGIKAGENKGKIFQHDFVVTGYDSAKATKNKEKFTLDINLPKAIRDSPKSAVVVWVSDSISQSPMQVVGSWL